MSGLSVLQRHFFLGFLHHLSLWSLQCEADRHATVLSRSIAYMGFQIDSGLRFGYLVVRHEQTTSGYLVLIIGIRDEHIIMGHQPAVPVYTSEIGKIKHALLLADRIGRVVTVVGFHGYHIFFTKLQQRTYIHDNWQIATIVFLY